jgi:hypothetical protein
LPLLRPSCRLSTLKGFFYFAGFDFTNYLNKTWQDTGMAFHPNQYNDLGKETAIYRILTGTDFQGLSLVYSDENAAIYSRSP